LRFKKQIVFVINDQSGKGLDERKQPKEMNMSRTRRKIPDKLQKSLKEEKELLKNIERGLIPASKRIKGIKPYFDDIWTQEEKKIAKKIRNKKNRQQNKRIKQEEME